MQSHVGFCATYTAEPLGQKMGMKMSDTIIESDLTVDGNMKSPEGTVNVKGKVKGDIAAKKVDVALGGQVDGAVDAELVSIEGTQSGSVTCGELSLGTTSHVKSKVTAKTMVSERGAKLVGEVKITGT